MSDRLIHILLIDDDPIFRLGLSTALEGFPDLQVVAEFDTGAAGLEYLRNLQGEEVVELVVLELALGRIYPQALSGLSLCRLLKTDYPDLPILVVTAQSEPTQLAVAKQLGVEGYCSKGSSITTIVEAIRQLHRGESSWQRLPVSVSSLQPPSWHHRMRQSGLRQIDEALAQAIAQLQNPHLSKLDWLFWNGRRRELLAARWVVNQLLPTDAIVVEQERFNTELADNRSQRQAIASENSSTRRQPLSRLTSGAITRSELSLRNQPLTLLEVTVERLQSGLQNLTDTPLEIDILQGERKQDVLYIVLKKFEEVLDALRFSQVTPEQLPQKRSRLLQDLWQVSLTNFFGKYYTVPVGNQQFELVDVLLQDAAPVQIDILDKIPLVIELLANQLFDAPLMIDNVSYSAQTPEALGRAEILLQNLIIQVANAVVQPLLNRFGDVETIKHSFFDRQLISSREIARFRNNLSWRYRRSELLDEPEAIFESRYDLFVLSDIGIKKTSIYAPRRQELEQLRGIRLAVTLAYEFRDASSPRLRGTIGWLGKGVVYVLTQVVGRAIGLVIRGVIQGVGSALNDTRFGRNGK
ncbi:DUF3685 domain-containing protein [Coleofasciculus sp. LEGE 07092]|uniref:DUF3685 domain-containing protein n=2 Tax=unclassified Coleofasciculus TaxID=2692782 RepID=UPI001880710E|nr:DUF3685 domain-containing protein [Coleofasciculus sp. LEGE 07092]MBE9130010.1 DUF3685 domain-containing protein [Coleofasciculus sp. LEGE 07081]MBE9152383.1 DUF3685 domain-containing protein [Coleofasciculus sp. LEGE 07092]